MRGKIVGLAIISLIAGAACELVGYGPITMYGKTWLRYKAKSGSDTAFTDPVGACEAEYVDINPDPSVTDMQWRCKMKSNGYPILSGVWKQTARLEAGTNCVEDWDTGVNIVCPGSPDYPRVWDMIGPVGYSNGQRGPM